MGLLYTTPPHRSKQKLWSTSKALDAAQEFHHNLFPLRTQARFRLRPPRAPVPVTRIPRIAFFTMEIRMHPRAVRGFDLLRNRMRPSPVAFSIPPKRQQKPAERVRPSRLKLPNRQAPSLLKASKSGAPHLASEMWVSPSLGLSPYWPIYPCAFIQTASRSGHLFKSGNVGASPTPCGPC
jgi:hypothetical protein